MSNYATDWWNLCWKFQIRITETLLKYNHFPFPTTSFLCPKSTVQSNLNFTMLLVSTKNQDMWNLEPYDITPIPHSWLHSAPLHFAPFHSISPLVRNWFITRAGLLDPSTTTIQHSLMVIHTQLTETKIQALRRSLCLPKYLLVFQTVVWLTEIEEWPRKTNSWTKQGKSKVKPIVCLENKQMKIQTIIIMHII